MSGMKVLPRYRPNPSGVGCAEHNDPTCLCDVVVDTPVPILRTKHKFHNIVLHELNDDTVSERNLYEFFSVVLGLFELECALKGLDTSLTQASWKLLPENVRAAVHNHARADSPWSIASMEMEGLDLSVQDVKEVRRCYGQLTGTIRAKRRKGPISVRSTMSDDERRDLDAAKKRDRLADPVKREQVNARKRAARARASAKGKSWMEARRTGMTPVPGTYALEDCNG